LHNIWPLISAKFTQFAPVFGEKALKKRPFNMKYAVLYVEKPSAQVAAAQSARKNDGEDVS